MKDVELLQNQVRITEGRVQALLASERQREQETESLGAEHVSRVAELTTKWEAALREKSVRAEDLAEEALGLEERCHSLERQLARVQRMG